MNIISLAQRPELVDTLASWHFAQWADLYPGWTLDACREELRAPVEADQSSTTLVAIDDDGQPAGSVSLLTHDLPGWDHLSPWLGNLYVRPDRRGRGIGSVMLLAAVAEARRLGIEKLHLFTISHEGFFAARAWQIVGQASAGGRPVTIMSRRTDPLDAYSALE